MITTKTFKASSLMTRNVVVANENNKFSQLMEFFTKHKIQHLPVAAGERLMGIVSINDMAGYLNDKLVKGTAINAASLDATFNVKDVMTANPVCVDPDDSFEKVISLLAEGKFQAIPVVKAGVLHGIITNKDVVKIYNWQLNQ